MHPSSRGVPPCAGCDFPGSEFHAALLLRCDVDQFRHAQLGILLDPLGFGIPRQECTGVVLVHRNRGVHRRLACFGNDEIDAGGTYWEARLNLQDLLWLGGKAFWWGSFSCERKEATSCMFVYLGSINFEGDSILPPPGQRSVYSGR